MLSSVNLPAKRLKVKWSDKWYGPYKILSSHQHGTSYRLDLPKTMGKVHPVFHTLLLKPYKPNTIPGRAQPPPPKVVIGKHNEFVIEKILDLRIRNGRRKFLVRWEGYTADQDEWLDINELHHAKDLLNDFYQKYKIDPNPKNNAGIKTLAKGQLSK